MMMLIIIIIIITIINWLFSLMHDRSHFTSCFTKQFCACLWVRESVRLYMWESVSVHECVHVSVHSLESLSLCVRLHARAWVCVWVCACLWVRESVCLCMSMCVSLSMRECELVYECVWESEFVSNQMINPRTFHKTFYRVVLDSFD